MRMVFFVSIVVERKNVIISEGNRPLWQRVIAAIHYTAILYLLFKFFIGFDLTSDNKKLKGSLSLLEIAIFLFPSALAFSVVKDILFDLEQRKYKIQYCVGPIRVGKWQALPDIEYVSVFKQPKADGGYAYEANLWYAGNRHFNVCESDLLEPAYKMGENVAKVLQVNLLDATEANNNKWVKFEDITLE